MNVDYCNDYGSRSSLNSTLSWLSGIQQPMQVVNMAKMETNNLRHCDLKSSSASNLLSEQFKRDEAMLEFRLNGVDTPYNPETDWGLAGRGGAMSGMGPSSAYLRQKSWPDPERTPKPRLPRPASEWIPSLNAREFIPQLSAEAPELTTETSDFICTSEQRRVLKSLPKAFVYNFFKALEQENVEKRGKECRFCKNNGERDSYYRAHSLKDEAGRVVCPVLRSLVCRRCGASGDRAHTIKYCPLATENERKLSSAMMRSMRLASGRRREYSPPSAYSAHSPPSAYSAHSPPSAYSAHSPPSAYSAHSPPSAYSAHSPPSAYSAHSPLSAYSAQSPSYAYNAPSIFDEKQEMKIYSINQTQVDSLYSLPFEWAELEEKLKKVK